jgi:hypothetical protein
MKLPNQEGEIVLGQDGLRRAKRLELPPSVLPGINLCNPAHILSPEQHTKRDADLAQIAERIRQPVPDDIILT